jgi:murein hydrolase activator
MNRLCALAVLLMLSTAAAPPAAAQATQQAQLQQLRTRIDALSKSIEKDQAERRIAATEAELKSLQQQTESQRGRIHETEKQLVSSRRSLEQRYEGLARQLRAAYAIGRQGHTQLLLNQNDVHKVGRVLVYYDYLQRAQVGAIDNIRSRVNELEAMSERLQGEVARLTDLKSRQEAALAQLRSSRGERTRMLAKLRERIADERAELKRLRDDEQAIGKLIERVQETLSELPSTDTYSDKPFSGQRGKLPWPARGKLIARYGEPKAGGKLSWKGHWIATAEGAPVRAVARGRVVYVGWMHRYGLIVLVEHDGGYYSLYGHAQSATVNVGDSLRAGQVLARAGDTGGHDQSGVYFELRKGTQAIDPRQWLAR